MNIEEITNLLSRGKFKSAEEIKKLISSLKDVYVVPSLIMAQGTLLYRARVIDNINEIHTISDLSYTPTHYNKSYKRASTPSNTMFYGVSGDLYSDVIYGCLSEVCECFRVPMPSHKNYKVVIGIWETTRDFVLPQIINPDGDNKSEAFSNVPEYLSCVGMLDEKGKQIADFQRLINYEFTKRADTEQDYWISAIFTEWIISLKDTYDGVIYESVQSIDAKLSNNHCVALKPQVVDDSLQFKEALFYEFDFTGINTIVPKPTIVNIPPASH